MNTKLNEKKPFKFNGNFVTEFNRDIKIYSCAFKELNDIVKNKNEYSNIGAYNVCASKFKMRFISPDDFAKYVDYLIKTVQGELIDIEKLNDFTVSYVYRAMKDNGFDCFSTGDIFGNYINTESQDMTLEELLVHIDNEVYPKQVISADELKVRRESVAKGDFTTIENMHFGAVMKNIVNEFEKIITNECGYIVCDDIKLRSFKYQLETFLLFAIKFNIINITHIIKYLNPTVKFNNCVDEETNKTVTECCVTDMLKTKDMMNREQLPFDFNMKNIVLSDTDSNFKDTESALVYITKNKKSPISMLLRQHATPKITCASFCEPSVLFKMVEPSYDIPVNKVDRPGSNPDVCANNFYTKYENTNFRTNPTWLSSIAFSDNYANENYRTDNMGHNKHDDMCHIMRTIYKMFSVDDCQGNTELADNIIGITSTMLAIIRSYSKCEIENYSMAKDILALLGEIFTKGILKLYYNNNTPIIVSDNMNDTMIPSILYNVEECDLNFDFESNMFMEDGEVQVTVTNQDGAKVTSNKKDGFAKIIEKIRNWLNKTLKNYPVVFNKKYKTQVANVVNNPMNNTIIDAINKNSFDATIKNFPNYNVSVDDVKLPDGFVSSVDKIINDGAGNNSENIFNLYPEKMREALKNITSDTNRQDEIKRLAKNLILYGDTKHDETNDQASTKLTKENFESLINNIKNSQRLIEVLVNDDAKKIDEGLKKCSDARKNAENNDDNAANTSNIDVAFNECKTISVAYARETIISVVNDLFQKSYNAYKSIVDSYNNNNATTTTTNTPETTTNAQTADVTDAQTTSNDATANAATAQTGANNAP